MSRRGLSSKLSVVLLGLLLASVALAQETTIDADVVRGEYLVKAGGCFSCHTADEDDAEPAMNRAVEVNKVIGSPGFPRDVERLRQKGLESYERAYYPPGVSRQMAAVITNGDRSEKLNGLNLPTLVIHGADDPLIPVTGGIDTHENVPGSELMVIDGMGHDLPMGAWDQIVSGITTVTEDGVYARLTEPAGA